MQCSGHSPASTLALVPDHHLDMKILPGEYAVCRMPPGSPLPALEPESQFLSLTVTEEEISWVGLADRLPSHAHAEPGWRAIEFIGPFPFTMTGVLASALIPLAAANIGIFAISTFDTDYILIKAERLEEALEALRGAGHTVLEI